MIHGFRPSESQSYVYEMENKEWECWPFGQEKVGKKEWGLVQRGMEGMEGIEEFSV